MLTRHDGRYGPLMTFPPSWSGDRPDVEEDARRFLLDQRRRTPAHGDPVRDAQGYTLRTDLEAGGPCTPIDRVDYPF